MHVALLGDVPAKGGGLKPLLQWQDAHRRKLQGFSEGAHTGIHSVHTISCCLLGLMCRVLHAQYSLLCVCFRW